MGTNHLKIVQTGQPQEGGDDALMAAEKELTNHYNQTNVYRNVVCLLWKVPACAQPVHALNTTFVLPVLYTIH